MAQKLRIKGKVIKTGTPPNFISVFAKEAIMLANEHTEEFAKTVAVEAKEIIRKQEFKWAPLSEKYAKRKEREGLDPRILVATKDYVNNGIGWWKRIVNKKVRIFVGPKPGTHEPSELPYQLIARWFEFGTERMPARQLWRSLLSRLLKRSKQFRRSYNAAVARALGEKMKRRRQTTVSGTR